MNEYKGVETWGQLSTRSFERKYISPEERQRLERVAVGRICRCNDCICCAELKAASKLLANHSQN
jgi:hypothetical protein